jgi:hypothetical protein
MEHTLRLFSCARCHTQTVICSHCDRGQIYCGSECSIAARLQSKRAADKRYQLTPGGKMKHALRQRRYRERLNKIVTDHGSHSPTQNALLQPVKNEAKEMMESQDDLSKRCCFCKKSVSSWLRNGFLRHHATRSARDLPYLRPP